MSPEYPDQKEIEEALRALEGIQTAAEAAKAAGRAPTAAEVAAAAAAEVRAFALAERIGQTRARRLGTAIGGAELADEILAGVFNRPDPHTWHGDAVRRVLTDAEGADENAAAALADDPGWRAWRQNFAGDLYAEGLRLVAELGGPDAPRRRPAEAEDGPMGAGLWADLVAAGFLRDLGAKLGGDPEHAAKMADAAAQNAATRWAAYQSDPEAPADPIPEWLLDVFDGETPDRATLMREGGVRNNAAALWRWWTPEPEPSPAPPWQHPGGTIQPPRMDGPPPPPGVLVALAAVLWSGRWKALAADQKRRAAYKPALTARGIVSVVSVLSPATRPIHDGDGYSLVGGDGRPRGHLPFEELAARLSSGGNGIADADVVTRVADELVHARALVAGVYSFLHAVHTVTELYRAGAGADAQWGDWKTWAAEVADLADVKLTPDLRTMLYRVAWFGNGVQLDLFDGRKQKGLWLLTAPDPFKRGRPKASDNTRVAFRYSPILTPGWAAQENPQDRNRGVRLVAVPQRLPVGPGNPAVQAAAMYFSLYLIAEVASKAADSTHGIAVTPAIRARLAGRAGLNDADACAQIYALLDAGEIEEVGSNRYRLGNPDSRQLSRSKGERLKGAKRKGR